MKTIKYLIVIILLVAGQQRIVVAQKLLTLERTLEIAYESSPEMISQNIALENQRENVNATKARLKSKFSLSVDPFTYSIF